MNLHGVDFKPQGHGQWQWWGDFGDQLTARLVAWALGRDGHSARVVRRRRRRTRREEP